MELHRAMDAPTTHFLRFFYPFYSEGVDRVTSALSSK
jgi:hypothetical protein